jgi:anaerobic ribonucleoside-triphosphate reductase
MNLYCARQHQETQKWKYVMFNDNKCYLVGYCATDKCEGHNTEKEACEHYRQYLLDTRLRYFTENNEQRKCKVCGEWTQGRATIDMEIFDLCPTHQTREVVETLYGKVGECWSSY